MKGLWYRGGEACICPLTAPGHVTPGEASAPLQVWGIALLNDTLTPGWWEVCLCHLPVMRHLHLGSCLGEWDCSGERTTPMSAKM